VVTLDKINKLIIIKFGDTVEEFKLYSQIEKNEEDVYSPTWDYIPQFYKECKEILKNCIVYWIGLGGNHNKFYKYKNNWFITIKIKYSDIYIYYWLLKVNPDLIINISSQKPIIPLYFFKLIKNKTKILQFLAGEYYDNPLNMLFNSLLKKSNGIYVTNKDTKLIVEQYTNKKIDLFLPLHTSDFLRPNKIPPSIRVEDKLNVIYCGRFSEIKGIWDLFEIINKLKGRNIIFHLIGEGKELPKFKQKIKLNMLDDMVIFHGFVPHEQLYGYFKQADIGIVPSKTEGYCSVIHEFMISKVPTLATKVGGLKDVITDGENGYLIEEENKIEKFIEKINYLNNNPEEIKQMKRNITPTKYLDRENVFGKIVKNYYLEQFRNKK
jgi:glycosyltransferase involved in cell wall biosynthesis